MIPLTSAPIALHGESQEPAAPALTSRQREAVQQFEAIFLRQLLGSLEKAGTLGGKSSTPGAGAYGSMMVGALADQTAQSGGIGLADMIAESFRQLLKAEVEHTEPTNQTQPKASQVPI